MGTAKIQGELWSKAPHGWAGIQEPQHKPLWDAMLDATNVGEGTRFLDAGCGAGGASLHAATRGAQVSGLDAAEGLLNYAKKRVPAGEFRVGDIENLPYEDNQFDVVFAANSVQYSADRVATLRELNRVCAPNGHIVAGLFGAVETVAYAPILKALGAAMPNPPKGGGPFELSAPGKFEALFAQAGLEVIASGEADCPFVYADFETFWQGNVAAGPLKGMLRVVTEDHLRNALSKAITPFHLDSGQIEIKPNMFKFLVASAK